MVPFPFLLFIKSQRDLNASLGVLGMIAFGIASQWIPFVTLNIPLPNSVVLSMAITTFWQTLMLVIVPYVWAAKRLGMSLQDLGLRRSNLGTSTLFGCGLYMLALAAFVHCSGGNVMTHHIVRRVDTPDAFMLVALMGTIAAGTDLTTRGFILLTLTRYTHVAFAILMQNLVWFLGHLHEIKLLADCLGVTMATALTLTLGIVGDVIVLRTRNVIGLAIAHFMLNIVLAIYIRHL
jgi:membrane protease YdiL (CAAX protease family)